MYVFSYVYLFYFTAQTQEAYCRLNGGWTHVKGEEFIPKESKTFSYLGNA